MTDSDFPEDVLDELDREISIDDLFSNQRIAVRYRRNDIKAVVKLRTLFFPSEFPVQLIDISSKGAAIQSPKKLKRFGKVSLYLRFGDGKSFSIDGSIAHTDAAPRYGLKFDKYNHGLGDYLLHTQTDLIFG